MISTKHSSCSTPTPHESLTTHRPSSISPTEISFTRYETTARTFFHSFSSYLPAWRPHHPNTTSLSSSVSQNLTRRSLVSQSGNHMKEHGPSHPGCSRGEEMKGSKSRLHGIRGKEFQEGLKICKKKDWFPGRDAMNGCMCLVNKGV